MLKASDVAEKRELRPVCLCRRCRGEIWPWEDFGVDDDGRGLCSDCAEDIWRELRDFEKLELLGYEPKMVTRREYI